jgi:hypothetical protein
MSKYPYFNGAVQTLSGTSIVNTYTASSTVIQPSVANRIRFYVRTTLAGGSSVNTVTIKLQFKYDDDTTALGFLDLPSSLDDVQGAAQPKGSTLEVEHAFSVSAGANTDSSFYLDKPYGISALRTAIKANTTGNSADSVTIYAVAG